MPSNQASLHSATSTRQQGPTRTDESADLIQWPISLAHIRPQLESLAEVWSQPAGASWLLHEDGSILPLANEQGHDSHEADQTQIEHIRCPLNGQWSIVVGGVSKNEAARFRNAVDLLGRLAQNQTELEATVTAAIEATDELVALQQLVAIQIDALDNTTLTEYIARSTNAMTKAAAVVLIDENGRQTTSGTPSAVDTLVSFLGDDPKPQIRRADDSGAPFDYVVKRLAGNLATIAIAGLPGVRITTPQLRHLDSVSGHATGLLRLAKQQQHMVERAVIDRDAEAAALMAAQVLPDRLPAFDGYQVAARCEPARMAAGDFYQFIETGDRFVAVIGDVSGKGLAAAMVMGMVASHAHRSALELPDADAAKLLEAINNATYAYLTKVGRFVTLAVIVCNSSDGTVSVCNAGHSPLLLATDKSNAYNIASIPADAPPLGVLAALDVTANTLTLSAGDRLVAGTDGLAEQEDGDGHQYGYPEFERLVSTAVDHDAGQLLDHLFTTVDTFAGGNPPDDDRTAFILQRLEP